MLFLAQYEATLESGKPFQTFRLVEADSLVEAREVADRNKNNVFPLFSEGESVYVSSMLTAHPNQTTHDDNLKKVIEDTPQW